MAGNYFKILQVLAHSLSKSCCYEAVGSTVEAVLSYVELFIALVGETEHISLFGHCLVECCIEYNYLRTVCGDYLLAGSQSKCVGWL